MNHKREIRRKEPYVEKRTLCELIELTLGEIEGVHKLSFPFRKAWRQKWIELEETEQGLYIRVYIAMSDAVPIVSTCTLLQEQIKERVRALTGLAVSAVTIKVEQMIKAYQ